MSLLKFAKQVEDPLRPFGQLDVLLLYGVVAQKLTKLLKGKELAAKNWLPPGGLPYVIKRGSKAPPLWIEQFATAITPEFLETRSKIKALKDAKGLTKSQELAWMYFIPRKLSDFFYATNGELSHRPSIDRIFFDIDRGTKISADKAQIAAAALVDAILDDDELRALIGNPELLVSWTGRSFHVFIFLKKPQPSSFYDKYFKFTKDKPENSFTGRWAETVRKKSGLPVYGGHEKKPEALMIDPSQTPSGKLCRVPFGSLHMADWKTVDGVSLPLKLSQLKDPGLTKELATYTPKKLIANLNKLTKNLPKRFQ
jgi:hypothetical protein